MKTFAIVPPFSVHALVQRLPDGWRCAPRDEWKQDETGELAVWLEGPRTDTGLGRHRAILFATRGRIDRMHWYAFAPPHEAIESMLLARFGVTCVER